jgi:hypothetical protein
MGRRAKESRRLSPDERRKQIAEMIGIGMEMVHRSPKCAQIEQRMEAQEVELRRRQRELFRQYDGGHSS